jgi:hypothetical protein
MASIDPELHIRLPLKLKEELEQAAKRNARTLTAEVVARLKAQSQEDAAERLAEALAAETVRQERALNIQHDMITLLSAFIVESEAFLEQAKSSLTRQQIEGWQSVIDASADILNVNRKRVHDSPSKMH